MIELLATASLTTRLIPSLARGVCWERAALWVLFLLLRCFVVPLVRVDECLHRDTHVFGERFATLVVFHHSAASVVLAMPDDLIRSSFVQAEPKRWLVFPHLPCDVVPAAKLIRKALAVFVQHKTTYTTQGFCRQEFNLSISVIRLYKAC